MHVSTFSVFILLAVGQIEWVLSNIPPSIHGGQQVVHVPGKQVIHVPGKQIVHVPGKQIVHVPGQASQVVHVPGPEIVHIPGKEIIHVPGREVIHKQLPGEIIHKQTPAEIIVKQQQGLVFTVGTTTYTIIRFIISAQGVREEVDPNKIIPSNSHTLTILYILRENGDKEEIAQEEYIPSTNILTTYALTTVTRHLILNDGSRQQISGEYLIQGPYLRTVQYILFQDELGVYRHEVADGGLIPSNYQSVSVLYVIFPSGKKLAVSEEEYSPSSQILHVTRYLLITDQSDGSRKLVDEQNIPRMALSLAQQTQAIRYLILDDNSHVETSPGQVVPSRLSTIIILYLIQNGEQKKVISEEIYTPGYPYSVTRRFNVLSSGTLEKVSQIAVRTTNTITTRFLLKIDGSVSREIAAGELLPNNLQTNTIIYLLLKNGVRREITHELFIPAQTQSITRIFLILGPGEKKQVSEEVVPDSNTVSTTSTVFVLLANGNRQQTTGPPPSAVRSVTVNYIVASSSQRIPFLEEEVEPGTTYSIVRRFLIHRDGVRQQISEVIVPVPSTSTTVVRYIIDKENGARREVALNEIVPRTSSIINIRYINLPGQRERQEFSQEDIIPGSGSSSNTIIRYFVALPNQLGEKRKISEDTVDNAMTYLVRYLNLPNNGGRQELQETEQLPVKNVLNVIHLVLPSGDKKTVSEEQSFPSTGGTVVRIYFLLSGTRNVISEELVPEKPTPSIMHLLFVVLSSGSRKPVLPNEVDVIPPNFSTVTITYLLLEEPKPISEEEYIPGMITTIIRRFIILLDGSKQKSTEEIVPSSSSNVRVIRYLLNPQNNREELSPGEITDTPTTVITVVYIVNPSDQYKRPYSEDELYINGKTVVVRHFLILQNGLRNPDTSTEQIFTLTPPAPSSTTMVVRYLLLPGNKYGPELGPNDPIPNTSSYVIVQYLVSPSKEERKPVSEIQILRDPTTKSTRTVFNLIISDGTRKRVNEQQIPSIETITVRYIQMASGERKEVPVNEPVTSTTKNIYVTYRILANNQRQPVGEDEVEISPTTTSVTRYLIINGQKQQTAKDVVPSPLTRVTVVKYIVNPDNSRQSVSPSQPISEDTHTVEVISLLKPDGSIEEFSEDEVIPSPTAITTIRYLFRDGKKEKISEETIQRETLPEPEQHIESFTTSQTTYLILADNSRREIQPNQIPSDSHTITILFAILKDGTKKDISEVEVIPTSTTTKVVTYTITPTGDKHKVTTQDMSSSNVKILRLLVLPSGERKLIQPGEKVPMTEKTVTVIYEVIPGNPDKPFSEIESDIVPDTTTTKIYLIQNGLRELVAEDVTPSASARTVTQRFIISPTGFRRELGPNEAIPKDSSSLTIIYLVKSDGSKQEISEEEVTVTPQTRRTIKYAIRPDGSKQEISEDVIETIVETAETEVFLLLGDGSRSPVPTGELVPNTASTVTVTLVREPNGNKRILSEREVIRTTEVSTIREYKISESGERVKTSEQTIPNPNTNGTKYFITLLNGLEREATPGEIARYNQKQIQTQTYYIIDKSGQRRQVSAAEFKRLQTQPQQTNVTEDIYYVTDASGNRRQVSAEEYRRLQQQQGNNQQVVVNHGGGTDTGTDTGTQEVFIVTDANGKQRQVTAEEFKRLQQQGQGKVINTNDPGGSAQKYIVTDSNGKDREVSAEEFERLQGGGGQIVTATGNSGSTQKYFVTDGNGKQREVSADEFARLQAGGGQVVTSNTVDGGAGAHTYFVTDSNGKQREVSAEEFNRLKADGGQVTNANSASSQTYFVTGTDGKERQVSATEFARLKSQGGSAVVG